MNEQFDEFVKSKGPVFYEVWINWQKNLITQTRYIEELEQFLLQHKNVICCDQVEKLRATLLDNSSADLNKLYTVINRCDRLKTLLEMQAIDVIINNERRILQVAIDSL